MRQIFHRTSPSTILRHRPPGSDLISILPAPDTQYSPDIHLPCQLPRLLSCSSLNEDVAPRHAPVRARRRLQPGSIHVAACWKPSKPWAPGVAPVGGSSPAKDGGGERQAAVRGDPAQGRRGVHGHGSSGRWRVGAWVARADAAALFASDSPRHGGASDGARAGGARMIAIHVGG
jgi:hypothetical protein